MLTDDELDRYSRHILLKDIGGAGQMHLKGAKVALVGAGGIGAPCALYLAAAGVGHITLIDDDVVSLSNLQRQVIFQTEDVGKAKTERAACVLNALNPYTDVVSKQLRLDAQNVRTVLQNHDVVVDGSDNFETRHLVNETCQALRIPLVSAALGRFDGQLAVFDGDRPARCRNLRAGGGRGGIMWNYGVDGRA
jgi:adenylyltransferase/sulfurtransferase